VPRCAIVVSVFGLVAVLGSCEGRLRAVLGQRCRFFRGCRVLCLLVQEVQRAVPRYQRGGSVVERVGEAPLDSPVREGVACTRQNRQGDSRMAPLEFLCAHARMLRYMVILAEEDHYGAVAVDLVKVRRNAVGREAHGVHQVRVVGHDAGQSVALRFSPLEAERATDAIPDDEDAPTALLEAGDCSRDAGEHHVLVQACHEFIHQEVALRGRLGDDLQEKRSLELLPPVDVHHRHLVTGQLQEQPVPPEGEGRSEEGGKQYDTMGVVHVSSRCVRWLVWYSNLQLQTFGASIDVFIYSVKLKKDPRLGRGSF